MRIREGYLFFKKRYPSLTPSQRKFTLRACSLKSCTRCAIRCGVHGFAMNPYVSLHISTAPYYREARVTFARRQTACRMRHCCARRIVGTGGRRELGCTPTRWAERHPQGVCRIRKAAEPPTAAQQRMIEAAANRIETPNAATPRYGQCNRQALQLFELLACNGGVKGQSPLRSLGGPRGIFSFVKENIPLIRIPCTVQGTSICPLAKAIVAAILQKAPFGHNYRK